MTTEGPTAPAAWAALRKTATVELCAEGRLGDDNAERDIRLERWWVRSARDELLRLSTYDAEGRRTRGPLLPQRSEADRCTRHCRGG